MFLKIDLMISSRVHAGDNYFLLWVYMVLWGLELSMALVDQLGHVRSCLVDQLVAIPTRTPGGHRPCRSGSLSAMARAAFTAAWSVIFKASERDVAEHLGVVGGGWKLTLQIPTERRHCSH